MLDLKSIKQLLLLLFLLTGGPIITCLRAQQEDGNSEELRNNRENILRNIRDNETDSVIYFILESENASYNGHPNFGVSTNLSIATYFEGKMAYRQSLKYRLKELVFHEQYGPELQMDNIHLFCLGGIAHTYDRLDQPDSALIYLRKTLAYASQKKNRFFLLHAYNNLGYHYQLQKDYRTSIAYYEKALALSHNNPKPEEKIMFGIISGNLGSVYQKSSNLTKALEFLNLNLISALESHDYSDFVQTSAMVAAVFNQLGKPQRAIDMLITGERLAKEHNINIDNAPEYFKSYYNAYLQLNDIPNFRHYLIKFEESYSAKQASQRKQLMEALDNVTTQAVAKQEVEAKKAAELSSLRQQRMISFGFIFLLIAGMIAVFYFRKNREAQRKAELEATQKELLKVELRNRELEQARLDAELQNSQKDLTNLAMDLNYNETIKKTLVQKLQQVKRSEAPAEVQETISEMLGDLNKLLMDGQSRALFHENIGKVNHAFFNRLRELYPQLSKGDLEFCGLLRLKISPKEIATLKSISIDSVKVTRHRIRKKLAIEPSVDIYEFLENI